jgi:hypothetical protein
MYTDIQNLTKVLLNGEDIGNAFAPLLLYAQRKVENKRPWRVLMGRDTSLTLTGGDYAGGALTGKTIPASVLSSMDFSNERAVVLIDGAGNETPLTQVPMEARQGYYNIFGRYFLDLFNGKIYICGQATQNYTIGLNFKQQAPTVSSGQAWIFPSNYEPILAFGIATLYKKGIDYDFTNALQSAQGIDPEYKDLWQDMVYWDACLQADSLRGLDRQVDGGQNSFVSGQLSGTND